jgi:hypothetical protein
MICLRILVALLLGCAVDCLAAFGADEASPATSSPYAAWSNGPPNDARFFPIAVWLQSPANAAKYRDIGVNLYVALWQGPNAEQIAELKKQNMPVFCEQNRFARDHLEEKTIVGWLHGDEPDNAQEIPGGKGYGPPIPPEKIVEDYRQLRRNDPTRPVMLNLGQGVAWDGWYGRGVRTNHPEDYRDYIRGADIVSYDIYPAVHTSPEVAGKLSYVARGVARLREWTGNRKIAWNCIECTHIDNARAKPTPDEVKAEVWMSIVHGSQGIIYFCHEFKPRFVEAGLLADQAMAKAVGAINRQIHDLAEVINSPTLPDGVNVATEPAGGAPDRVRSLAKGPIAVAIKRHGGALYVFAVRMEPQPAKGVFQIAESGGNATVEVIGEQRTIAAEDGRFADEFPGWGVHLYKIRTPRTADR